MPDRVSAINRFRPGLIKLCLRGADGIPISYSKLLRQSDHLCRLCLSEAVGEEYACLSVWSELQADLAKMQASCLMAKCCRNVGQTENPVDDRLEAAGVDCPYQVGLFPPAAHNQAL